MKVSYVVLAHESFEILSPLLTTLLAQGSNIYLHYDLKGVDKVEKFQSLNHQGFTGKLFFAKRCLVKWGEWSIARATLNCIHDIDFEADDSDYFMLISGSCFPIKPFVLFKEFLRLNQLDFIECVNASKRRWVTGGIQNARWEKYHYFNYRFQPKRFAVSLFIQRQLQIKRKLPQGMTPYIGSQWWCLRRQTILKIIHFLNEHPEVERFYASTCIPDESFFQTIVGNLVPAHERSNQHLTMYNFNSWGIPRVFYNDDFRDLVLSPLYFARKVSGNAKALKSRLQSLYADSDQRYTQLVSSGTLDSNSEARRLLVRSLYENAKRDIQFGLLSSHSWLGVGNRIVLLAGPCESIVSSCQEWLSRFEGIHVLDTAKISNSKSLVAVIAKICYSNPTCLIVASIQGLSKSEVCNLYNAIPQTKSLILPADLGSFETPHAANAFYIKYVSDLQRDFPGLCDTAIDLFVQSVRAHQYGKQYYPSCPLFDRQLSVLRVDSVISILPSGSS